MGILGLVNTALLLNGVSEKDSDIRPGMSNALFAGRKVFPQISSDFPIRYFEFQSMFSEKINNAPI